MNAIEQIFGPSTSTSAVTEKKELGQEDFLKLLVAQLKNQDPNNPADNGEFLGQIAQFSMVSGIDDLGTSFDGVASSLYTGQAMQASLLVGKEVLVQSNSTTLTEGKPVSGVLGLESDAVNVKVHVYDASGSLVNVLDLGNVAAGPHRFAWSGQDADGQQYPAGEYSFIAEGLLNGELQGLPVQLFNSVQSVSVDRSNSSVEVHLANNRTVGMSQITEFK